MKKLSRLLKEARENAGLTQPQLATEIGVGVASIRGIEQGYTPTRGLVTAKIEEWIEKQKGGR
jgi:transcriptional regulator with XRE-family HTH domain